MCGRSAEAITADRMINNLVCVCVQSVHIYAIMGSMQKCVYMQSVHFCKRATEAASYYLLMPMCA